MNTFTEHRPYTVNDPLVQELFTEKALFYDIETTGFSAKFNKIYFIGCAYHRDEQLTVTQFFSESDEDEGEVLDAFLSLCEEFDTTISFNGLMFDLPFIRQRCQKLCISEKLTEMAHLDIYKQAKSLKNLLKLDSLKQKSIEMFLGLNREDLYNGGELINVYQMYQKDRDAEKLRLLKLHNCEDVLGMIDLLPILAYEKLTEGRFAVTEYDIRDCREYDGSTSRELYFTLRLNYPLPRRISYGKEDIYLVADGSSASIRVKLFCGELKYFYPNYRDYYYLPQEDMAVHKSVAAYVDSEFRVKAKADTCYSRKRGCFLPQYREVLTPSFRADYRDKYSYVELTEEFAASEELQKAYVEQLVAYVVK